MAFQATKQHLRDERDISPKRQKALARDTVVPVLQQRDGRLSMIWIAFLEMPIK